MQLSARSVHSILATTPKCLCFMFFQRRVLMCYFLSLSFSQILLQVGSMLINRVANTDMTWHQEVTNAAPRVSPIIDLTLDDSSVVRAIDNLNFIQMKREYYGGLGPRGISFAGVEDF